MVNSFDALSAREPELVKLRLAVRDFLQSDRAEFGWQPGVDSWLAGWDEDFSARLGAAGFIGLTIPQQYGGHGLGHLHRYVVTEELIAAGAPVAAHWTADRQVAPSLLTYGSEEQRERLLPKIVAGQLYSSIGMSEHGAGSDLAAVQTKAVRTDGGWLLSGSKVWTSGAHLAHQVVVLARSSPPDPEHRHAGFSQFLVPCNAEGVRIEPIILMSGAHHFNEVLFDQVFVPDADVLGEVGNGWHQVTSELSFERSGPERILSTGPLLFAAVRALGRGPVPDDRTAADIGDLMARLISLRQLSLSVARTLTDGGDAANQAALVKDLGTRFEAESVGLIADLLEAAPSNSELADNAEHRMAAQAHVHAAGRHQRGAARRDRPRNGAAMSALAGGVFASTDARDDDAQLRQLVDDLGQRSYDAGLGHRGIPDQFDAELWRNLEDTGLARLTSTPDAGAGPNELAIALYGLARHAGAVPLAETDALAGWLGRQTGIELPGGPLTVAIADAQADGNRVTGTAAAVPWARACAAALLAVTTPAGLRIGVIDIDPRCAAGRSQPGRRTARLDRVRRAGGPVTRRRPGSRRRAGSARRMVTLCADHRSARCRRSAIGAAHPPARPVRSPAQRLPVCAAVAGRHGRRDRKSPRRCGIGGRRRCRARLRLPAHRLRRHRRQGRGRQGRRPGHQRRSSAARRDRRHQ